MAIPRPDELAILAIAKLIGAEKVKHTMAYVTSAHAC